MVRYWHCSARWVCWRWVYWRLCGGRPVRRGSGRVGSFGLCGRCGLCAPGGVLLAGNCSGMPVRLRPPPRRGSRPVAGAGTSQACSQPIWSVWSGCWTRKPRCCCGCTRETSARAGCGWRSDATPGAGMTCDVRSRTTPAEGSADVLPWSGRTMGYIFPAPPSAA